ncbi:MAG: polyprenyl synthetase family protein [Bacteroidales bacterium]|nr:polyprenyl synthetase family protein [Bacteroidales bacterium]
MEKLEALQKKIRERIAGLEYSRQPENLYKPIDYTLNLGGKRLRPALCLLACDMFSDSNDKALETAIGIEIFHNFTLLHDDIMDEAPIRRGKETVYKKWNSNVAILSGDTMMALSYEFVMRAPENVRYEVFKIFNQTAIEVCEGQQYDMDFETQEQVTLEAYIEMIRLKTAVLLAGSLQIGALIGGADKTSAEILYKFGEQIGIAFQLKDDLLDAYSDVEKFGKTTGGDILENKKTFLFLKTLELANSEDRKTLLELYQSVDVDPKDKVSRVKAIFNSYEIQKHTENEIEKYYRLALDSLESLKVAEDRKTELLRFANQLKRREF